MKDNLHTTVLVCQDGTTVVFSETAEWCALSQGVVDRANAQQQGETSDTEIVSVYAFNSQQQACAPYAPQVLKDILTSFGAAHPGCKDIIPEQKEAGIIVCTDDFVVSWGATLSLCVQAHEVVGKMAKAAREQQQNQAPRWTY